ncbi:MAG: aminotransferase class V-fold PLP-dependent enzyme [Cyclobacteriaceae bacterium]
MEDLRKEFSILEQYTYLNTARFCALPKAVIRAQHDFLDHLNTHGSWKFDHWSNLYESTRVQAASLIGGEAKQTFFLPNTSLGFNMAAQYLPKMKVVCLHGDFPSVHMAWESHGFEVQYLDYKSDSFYDKLSTALALPNQILSLSWIQSQDGFEIDLKRIFDLCKENNHILVLDGTQGLGAIPFKIDPEVNCLFLASGFKWLMAGYGIAIGHASESLLSYLKPMRGWNSLAGMGIASGAKSLEVGNATYLNVAALSEGIKLIDKVSVEAICQHNLTLRKHVEEWCKQNGVRFLNYSSRSSILSMAVETRSYARLVDNNVQVTDQGDFVRISPHFYNNASDIEKMLDLIG